MFLCENTFSSLSPLTDGWSPDDPGWRSPQWSTRRCHKSRWPSDDAISKSDDSMIIFVCILFLLHILWIYSFFLVHMVVLKGIGGWCQYHQKKYLKLYFWTSRKRLDLRSNFPTIFQQHFNISSPTMEIIFHPYSLFCIFPFDLGMGWGTICTQNPGIAKIWSILGKGSHPLPKAHFLKTFFNVFF